MLLGGWLYLPHDNLHRVGLEVGQQYGGVNHKGVAVPATVKSIGWGINLVDTASSQTDNRVLLN